MPFILAHGAAGIYDEVLTVVVGIAFVVFIVYGWYKSRNLDPEARDGKDTIRRHNRGEDKG